MANYKKMYAVLCGAVDDAIGELNQFPFAYGTIQKLQDALYCAEEIYIDTSLYAVDQKEKQKVVELKLDHASVDEN